MNLEKKERGKATKETWC